ncbi:hypothetical protein YPPY56_1112, partial [Yersinia pestis PY-56]
MVLFYWD